MTTTEETLDLSDRDALKAAFAILRRQGHIARVNFQCCQSCAWSLLSEQAAASNPLGVVFWHNQDDESFGRDGNLERTLHLAWDGDAETICSPLIALLGADRVVVPDSDRTRIVVLPLRDARP